MPDIITMNLVIGKVPENYKHDASKQYATYPVLTLKVVCARNDCGAESAAVMPVVCARSDRVIAGCWEIMQCIGIIPEGWRNPWGMPMCEDLMQDVFIHSKDILRA